MSIFLLQPSFLMSKTKSYAQILINSAVWILVVLNSDGYSFKYLGSTTRSSTRWKFSYSLCTCSCGSDEYSCLYRYGYKHFLVPINKTSSFSSLFRNRYRNGCFFYVVYLSYWGVSGKTHVGHLLGVGCSFNFCIHLVPYLLGCIVFSKAFFVGSWFLVIKGSSCKLWCFQKLSVELASILICAGLIDIPIIKSSVNWWNTSHQPGSISRSGTSIHVPMPIPILSNFLFSTRIFFVLETRLQIPSFLESPLTEEIEARLVPTRN